ncbi:MAG: hypothetical protein LBR34_05300, partial [Prevotella sp.]|nr:hypothetical protein [Prevotella sp.]
NNVNSAELARKIGKTRQNVYDIYKRDDIEVKLFLTLSDILKHNFMEDVCPKKELGNDIDIILNAMKELIAERVQGNLKTRNVNIK